MFIRILLIIPKLLLKTIGLVFAVMLLSVGVLVQIMVNLVTKFIVLLVALGVFVLIISSLISGFNFYQLIYIGVCIVLVAVVSLLGGLISGGTKGLATSILNALNRVTLL